MTRPTRAAAAKAQATLKRARTRSASTSDVSVIVLSDSDDGDAFDPAAAAGARTSGSRSRSPLLSASPSPSILSVASDSDLDVDVKQTKRKRATATATATATAKAKARGTATAKAKPSIVDIEDCVPRPHGREYHTIQNVTDAQDAVLDWFESVRETRGMPWRKRYDPAANKDAKAQRAYEVWVSEVMLQQTQVATVIDYWTRWIQRWPTVADLAGADVEEVNAAWRGLGYYRRARSLLDGAKAVMGKKAYSCRLPDDPDELEKGIPGVGRYTAGAICSIAYGIRTPIVDGNVHRVLTRLLAVHANQTAPSTTRFLWDTAEALVDALPKGLSRGIAGDWNQALMELGATVCRPVNPDCGVCPLRDACKARAEVSTPPQPPAHTACDLCEPMPAPLEVTSFPMKKVKKASREENEVVVVTEWRGPDGERRWLFTKRPEKGLLAGLFEPPTVAVPADATKEHGTHGRSHVTSLLASTDTDVQAAKISAVAPVQHIFSHINMTYHAHHLVLSSPSLPELSSAGDRRAAWLDQEGVEGANVGTGVKKVWAAVYGKWGSFDVDTKAAPAQGGKRKRK